MAALIGSPNWIKSQMEDALMKDPETAPKVEAREKSLDASLGHDKEKRAHWKGKRYQT